VQPGRSLSTFRRNVLPLFSGQRSKPSKLDAGLLHSSTLKMEAIFSTEKSVNFYHAAGGHSPDDSTL
jgi:hypothetical protein